MDYFLQVFGEVTVGRAAVVIAALVFLAVVGKKAVAYISEKAIRDKQRDARIQKVIDQAEKYPVWHQQSIDIRDHLNGTIRELGDKLDTANKALEEIRKESSENRATTCRYRILRFDDEIRHDERHSKEHFDQILEDITEYETYCSHHQDYKNSKAVLAIENIKRIYQKCTNEGTFL